MKLLNIACINGDVGSTNGGIACINGDVGSTNGGIAYINGVVGSTNGGIAYVNGVVENVNPRIANINGAVGKINGVVESKFQQKFSILSQFQDTSKHIIVKERGEKVVNRREQRSLFP